MFQLYPYHTSLVWCVVYLIKWGVKKGKYFTSTISTAELKSIGDKDYGFMKFQYLLQVGRSVILYRMFAILTTTNKWPLSLLQCKTVIKYCIACFFSVDIKILPFACLKEHVLVCHANSFAEVLGDLATQDISTFYKDWLKYSLTKSFVGACNIWGTDSLLDGVGNGWGNVFVCHFQLVQFTRSRWHFQRKKVQTNDSI